MMDWVRIHLQSREFRLWIKQRSQRRGKPTNTQLHVDRARFMVKALLDVSGLMGLSMAVMTPTISLGPGMQT